MKTGGFFLLVSAALDAVGSVVSGFSTVGLFLLFHAGLYTAFWFGLRRGQTWVAWGALNCMLAGIAGTGIEWLKASSVPDWTLWGIIAADLVVAASLAKALFAKRIV